MGMKQETIIQSKLWDGSINKTKVYFPKEFYRQEDILKALNCLDLRDVSFSFGFGANDKGFDSFIVDFGFMINNY